MHLIKKVEKILSAKFKIRTLTELTPKMNQGIFPKTHVTKYVVSKNQNLYGLGNEVVSIVGFKMTFIKDKRVQRGMDLPATIEYHDNGKAAYKEWYKNGKIHRDGNKPSYAAYYSNGHVQEELWETEQSSDKDTILNIKYDKDGKIRYKVYSKKGKIYYKDGKKVSKKEYNKQFKK